MINVLQWWHGETCLLVIPISVVTEVYYDTGKMYKRFDLFYKNVPIVLVDKLVV